MKRIWNHSTKLMTSKHKQTNTTGGERSRTTSGERSRTTCGERSRTTIKPHTSSLRGRRKVFVGLSGGVDSSVAAFLLKKAGYDVTGVFMRVWEAPFLPCTWREDRREAMRAAAHLQIPFLTFNFSKEYESGVVNPMIAEYKRGQVPNPDVLCNREIKFGAFFRKARSLGADFIATGHYAKVKPRTESQEPKTYELLRGVDTKKDQSYFLWMIEQEALSRTLFPVGGLKKSEVRRIALEAKLPNALRKDSQGICFIGDVAMDDFLSHFIAKKKGSVINEKGEKVGTHDGVSFYAIGQRHGFSVTTHAPKSMPYYIVYKDVKKNILVVSHVPTHENYVSRHIVLHEIHWISSTTEENKDYYAKTRYQQDAQQCRIKKKDGGIVIIFKKRQNISPGQSIVLYDKDVCFGGGIATNSD